MRARASDHTVEERSRASIAETTWRLREHFGFGPWDRVNVPQIIRALEGQIISKRKGSFAIVFIDTPEGTADSDLTWVEYDPFCLYVDRELWRDAELGEPKAVFMLAHELGHLLLHDNAAKQYSGQGSKAIRKEESAEWQANTFARELCTPSQEHLTELSPQQVARRYNVPKATAEEAIFESRRIFKRDLSGMCCISCGNFSVIEGGGDRVCIFCQPLVEHKA